MKAQQPWDEEGRLKVEVGDLIAVIDGMWVDIAHIEIDIKIVSHIHEYMFYSRKFVDIYFFDIHFFFI